MSREDWRYASVLVLLVALTLIGCGGGGGSNAIPVQQQRQLYYGYYGVRDAQIPETIGHTNLLFELGHAGEPAGLAHIAEAKQPTVLGLQAQLWSWASPTVPLPFSLQLNAEANVRGRLMELRQADLLKYVVALYPIDEPDSVVRNSATTAQAIGIVRRVAGEFPELAGVKLAVFYDDANRPFFNIGLFDWVGLDNYPIGAEVLGERLEIMRSQMRPDQKLMLIPGGYKGQDPQPFVDKALADQQVIALVPFIWYDNADPAGGVVQGIRSNGTAAAYCRAGRQITKQSGVC